MVIRAVVYDIEIVKAIPEAGYPLAPGIEYCAGWEDHANMGVSVVGAYDYAEDRYRVFTQGNLDDFAALCAGTDLLVSFNGLGFDNLVLGHAGIVLPDERCYDILAEIWGALGRRLRGYRLDDLAHANFGQVKSGNGALAPVWWQQGQVGRVIDYCLNDVRLEKLLFDRILREGAIADPQGGLLSLRSPNGERGKE